MPSDERSAEWLRGAVESLEAQSRFGPVSMLEHYRALLAAAEAREAIPGDSLSTTVEKLREACSGVRVEPKPDAPTAAEAEHLLTIAKAALRRYAEGCWLPAKSDNSFSDRRGNPRMRLAAFEDQGGEVARQALGEIEILEASNAR